MGNRASFYTAVPFATREQPTMVQASSMLDAVSAVGLLLVDFLPDCTLSENSVVDVSICRDPDIQTKLWVVVHGDIVGARLASLRELLDKDKGCIVPEVRLSCRTYIIFGQYWISDLGDKPTQAIFRRLLKCSASGLTQKHLTQLFSFMGATVYSAPSLEEAKEKKIKAWIVTRKDTSGTTICIADVVKNHIRVKVGSSRMSFLYDICSSSLLYTDSLPRKSCTGGIGPRRNG